MEKYMKLEVMLSKNKNNLNLRHVMKPYWISPDEVLQSGLHYKFSQ